MRIGIGVPHYGAFASPEAIIAVGQAAEAMGFDSLWAGDRILAPLDPSDGYGGMPGVTMPPEFRTYLDPLAALTFAAAHTRRVRLGTSTLNAPWYPPVLLARALTTLDVLSNGRVDAGLGISWLRDEYAAVGVPWTERGDRLDETLDILRKIWADDVVEHHGRYADIVPSTIAAKPVQRPGPPILLAGFAPAAVRRVAARADGWLALPLPIPYLAGLWNTIQAEADKAGREPGAVRAVLRVNPYLTEAPGPADQVHNGGTIEQVAGYVREAIALGVDEVFFDLALTCSSTEQMIDVAGRLLSLLRRG
jgi:probable F420-dependent oxidoreductase